MEMKMIGTIKKTDNKTIIFVKENRRLEKLHRKEVTIKVENEYYFAKVIRYANRYVLYIPSTEPRNELEKKEEIEFLLIK